jgi:hypothetical protein
MLQSVMVKYAFISSLYFLQCAGKAYAEVITGVQPHESLQWLVSYLELHFQRTFYMSQCIGNLFDATVWRVCILFHFFSSGVREV